MLPTHHSSDTNQTSLLILHKRLSFISGFVAPFKLLLGFVIKKFNFMLGNQSMETTQKYCSMKKIDLVRRGCLSFSLKDFRISENISNFWLLHYYYLNLVILKFIHDGDLMSNWWKFTILLQYHKYFFLQKKTYQLL